MLKTWIEASSGPEIDVDRVRETELQLGNEKSIERVLCSREIHENYSFGPGIVYLRTRHRSLHEFQKIFRLICSRYTGREGRRERNETRVPSNRGDTFCNGTPRNALIKERLRVCERQRMCVYVCV